jgi:hypothetical protein
VGLSICNNVSGSVPDEARAMRGTGGGGGTGGTGGARRTKSGGSADARRTKLGGGRSGVGFVGRGDDDEGTDDGGVGFDEPGCEGASTGGDCGLVVGGACTFDVGGMMAGVDEETAEGRLMGGEVVGVGSTVDGDAMDGIDGCVVGESGDVRGAASTLAAGGGKRPGKTVGGCKSSASSMTSGGRFADAATVRGSRRWADKWPSSARFEDKGSTTVIAELDVVGRGSSGTGG